MGERRGRLFDHAGALPTARCSAERSSVGVSRSSLPSASLRPHWPEVYSSNAGRARWLGSAPAPAWCQKPQNPRLYLRLGGISLGLGAARPLPQSVERHLEPVVPGPGGRGGEL